MIIGFHGRSATAPVAVGQYRQAQLARLDARILPEAAAPHATTDEPQDW